MSTHVVTEPREERRPGAPHFRESAPSVVRQSEPTLARMAGMVGLFLLAFGLFLAVRDLRSPGSWFFGLWWGILFATTGVGGMLYHAASDSELQIRRSYGLLAGLLLLAGALLSVVPFQGAYGGLFVYGALCLGLALLFLLAFVRSETDPWVREYAVLLGVGFVALVLALTAFVGSNFRSGFLLPFGLVLGLLGLAYAWAFVALSGSDSRTGYQAGLFLGTVGAVVCLVALARSLLPALVPALSGIRYAATDTGLLLIGLGLLYVVLAVGLCSDSVLVVMTRRELSAIFVSPIAYIVLLQITIVGWGLFANFLNQLGMGRPMVEPIVSRFIIQWWPIICVVFIVPVLTMRLLSEERLTGTLEVVLTAPVDEAPVVLSKFFASLIFFLLLWVPWGLYLAFLRYGGGQPFDYRPLLSFFVALTFTGAGFLSMGLFFSSVTRDQIIAASLTFVGMLALTFVFFLKMIVEGQPGKIWGIDSSTWTTVLTHTSFVDLWINTLEGILVPKFLLFHLSATVVWLFLTVKVLEARKWS